MISARQNETKQKIRVKKTIYPDAPSPALLRIPLSLGTFFIKPENALKYPARSCHMRRKENRAGGCGVISEKTK